MDPHELADRLEQLGRFELYRDNSDTRSSRVWLTEAERDAIVLALRATIPDYTARDLASATA